MSKPRLVTTEPPDTSAILDALREAPAPTAGDPGFTTDELAAQTGKSTRQVLTLLRKLNAERRLVVGRQYRRALNGKMMPFTVYRVV